MQPKCFAEVKQVEVNLARAEILDYNAPSPDRLAIKYSHRATKKVDPESSCAVAQFTCYADLV